jgi:hypothetical protein
MHSLWIEPQTYYLSYAQESTLKKKIFKTQYWPSLRIYNSKLDHSENQ